MTQTVIIAGKRSRQIAHDLINAAPDFCVVTVKSPSRTVDQNNKMWAMLSDISRAKPRGRKHVPEMWKAFFMSALGHKVQFMEGIDGLPFPVGFQSSKLSRDQFAELITFIQWWGDENGVRWTDGFSIERPVGLETAETGTRHETVQGAYGARQTTALRDLRQTRPE